MIVAAAGLGFLLAVIWFDLMFDIQVWPYRSRRDETPEHVVASISTYYRRVTTDASPMGRLVAVVMLVTLAALVVVLVRDGVSAAGLGALVLAVLPIGYAGAVIVPAAVRLGAADDDLPTRRRLAHTIMVRHLACWCSVAAALALVIIRWVG